MAQNLLALFPQLTAMEKAWILWAMNPGSSKWKDPKLWPSINASEIGFFSRKKLLAALMARMGEDRIQKYVSNLAKKLEVG